jgi:uncharacterized protein YcbX
MSTPATTRPRGGSGLYVEQIWRYPIKSMAGEPVAAADLSFDGIAGDRLVHVRGERGLLTGRTRYDLLTLPVRTGPDGEPTITGHRWDSSEAAQLVAAAAGADARLVTDNSRRRFDVLPLLVTTTAEIAALGVDGRRLRPNLVIAGATPGQERDWPGAALRLGDAIIGVYSLRARCVATTIDPDTGAQDLDVLRNIRRRFAGRLGLDSWTIRPGRIQVGDPVDVLPLPVGLSPQATPDPGGWVTGAAYPSAAPLAG